MKLVNAIVPRFEFDAIKAHKPVVGADPEVAVGRLRERSGGRVDDPVLQSPRRVCVLS